MLASLRTSLPLLLRLSPALDDDPPAQCERLSRIERGPYLECRSELALHEHPDRPSPQLMPAHRRPRNMSSAIRRRPSTATLPPESETATAVRDQLPHSFCILDI